jgi:signal transduction histidine kinase
MIERVELFIDRVEAFLGRILDRLNAGVYWLLGPAIPLLHRLLNRLPRQADPFRSIKMKLGVMLLGSGFVGLMVFWYYVAGGIAWRTAAAAAAIGLITLQILAHGTTKPLRELTAAVRAMAKGDYQQRVRATGRDEVGELARAFNSMADELATVEQQRRELIANVSHELRTPITALQGVLENIVDGVSEPDPATLQAALAQTERLGRLVTELLDLSKVDAGAVPLNRVDIDVLDFLTTVVAEARLNAPRTRFRDPDVRRPAGGTLTVHADPERLHQVFANLLENAARHGPTDGLVTVGARAEGDSIVFEVVDQGNGIPQQLRGRVFERFTRGDRSARDGGTGLGLAIARWVVDMHAGSISVVDPPPGAGQTGCRMRIVLPALPGPGTTATRRLTPSAIGALHVEPRGAAAV